MERMCQRHGSDQTPTLLFESKKHSVNVLSNSLCGTKYLTYKEDRPSTAVVLNLPHDATVLIWHFSIIIVTIFVILFPSGLKSFLVNCGHYQSCFVSFISFPHLHFATSLPKWYYFTVHLSPLILMYDSLYENSQAEANYKYFLYAMSL